MACSILTQKFFARDALIVAKDLLGKVIQVRQANTWLAVQIIETEAYYLTDRGSHASLGYTEKRKALFMSPGTIYMYYARGGDSLNISCRGKGNAVLIKSGYPYIKSNNKALRLMQQFNPTATGGIRPLDKLCNGQTLLCKSLGLKVPVWNQQQFDIDQFHIEDSGYCPAKVIQTTRLGIPQGRDEQLMYRFIDHGMAKYCTQNPLTKRNWQLGKHYLET